MMFIVTVLLRAILTFGLLFDKFKSDVITVKLSNLNEISNRIESIN